MPETEYRNISAGPVPLASGRIIAIGDTCEPNFDEPHDQNLVKDGQLLPVEKTKKKEG